MKVLLLIAVCVLAILGSADSRRRQHHRRRSATCENGFATEAFTAWKTNLATINIGGDADLKDDLDTLINDITEFSTTSQQIALATEAEKPTTDEELAKKLEDETTSKDETPSSKIDKLTTRLAEILQRLKTADSAAENSNIKPMGENSELISTCFNVETAKLEAMKE
eukprot:gnl/Spiro4/29618_TR14525_c0_g1_i1.p2 gnl/Spiro4/29618_TR14525_c0_g1~~gnl/Spiro4/29618_TR14525_c0_g1_i1.p2  ORF type:complete len:168 (+),score=42.44 gnl/Spiro4/29618_TR14525_c0_g1_i1:33-536(+)